MPVAVARYSSGRIAIRHVLPVLWMTSCFRVMTNSHNNPFTLPTVYASAVYAVVVYLSVCLSQTSVVSKRLNGSNWSWYGSFLPLCCKEIRVSPKITLSQICYLTGKISPGEVSRVVNKVQGRSSLLTTLMTVDVWLDAHTRPSTAML